MATNIVSNLPRGTAIVNSVDTLLSETTANGTYTVANDMSQYAWIILIGASGGDYNCSITVPYILFRTGETFYLNYCYSSERTINVKWVNDNTVTVAGRANQNIIIMGVK